jgi:transcriptional regulator with XRE-family HTH domain
MTPRRISMVIRELRAAKGLTQVQLAKQAKVTRGYLAQLEAGHKVNPSLPTLRKLAKALGVPVTELLG